MSEPIPDNAPTGGGKTSYDRELLLHDYTMCHAGYTSRDKLVALEFSQLLQAFVLFASLTSAARILQPFNEDITLFVVVLLLTSGTFALIAFLINIEGKASSKKALRKRMAEIENNIDRPEVSHWKSIVERDKYPAEKQVKSLTGARREDGSASKYFVYAAYTIIAVWFILSGLLLFFGQFISV